tara:strand:+ start:1433 stop:1660 length:228 start_codon:yes stop_codon:yes gene_type:complete
MWWVFPTILGGIVLGIVLLLWCVVDCVRNKFAPEGTRGPLERAEWGDTPGTQPRFIGPTGPSWQKDQGPVNVYVT